MFYWLCVQLIESRVSTLHTAVEVSSCLDLVCIVKNLISLVAYGVALELAFDSTDNFGNQITS